MKMRSFSLAALALALGLATVPAQAATSTLSIVVTSAPSTSLTCTLTAPQFPAPVAAGTNVASCVVAPSTWSGNIALSGADAASFAIVGTNLNVGASALTTARSYAVTLTSTP